MRNLILITLSLVFVMAAGAMTASSQTRQDLLPIDKAYKVHASIEKPGTLVIQWKIAPHYYLYRGRMKFSAGKATTLGKANLPAGKKEHDQYLGDVEIYHNHVKATIPYKVAPDAKSVQVIVGYQGCHEVKPKICYPPHTETLNVPLSS